jgi:hypothetical protein
MIRNPFDGSHEHLTSSPRKGVAKGRIDKSESLPRSPQVGPVSGTVLGVPFNNWGTPN